MEQSIQETGTFVFANIMVGALFQIQVVFTRKDGTRTGVGIFTYKDGSKYVGQFIEDIKQGHGVSCRRSACKCGGHPSSVDMCVRRFTR